MGEGRYRASLRGGRVVDAEAPLEIILVFVQEEVSLPIYGESNLGKASQRRARHARASSWRSVPSSGGRHRRRAGATCASVALRAARRRRSKYGREALVESAQGRTLAMSVLRDLAPRRQVDEAQQSYLTLLHMAPDAIVVGGEGHRIVFWNKGAEATYGWTQEEALGRTPRELLKTRDRVPQVRGSLGATLEEQGFWEGEVTHTRKDGREIRVASRWQVQRDVQGAWSASSGSTAT